MSEISPEQARRIREHIERWQKLGPILDNLKMESLRHVNTAEAIEAFDLAYKSARLHCPPRLSSGLVEQQAWFRRARK